MLFAALRPQTKYQTDTAVYSALAIGSMLEYLLVWVPANIAKQHRC
mgnify:FL=1